MELILSGKAYPVEIVRSSRKTFSIQIKPEGRIIARAPFKMKGSAIEKYLNEKSAWIEKHLMLALESKEKFDGLPRFTAEEINEMAERALEIIPPRVRYYAEKLGVTYNRITIRNQKTRWGSCSSTGNLNFNCLLVLTPTEVLDSVVVHELCHRLHMDHSKAFYAEIYRVFPDYDKWDKWLKENGKILIKRMTG